MGDQSKRSNYISRVVASTNALIDAIAQLEELTQEGIYLGYVAAPDATKPGSLQDADFVGDNAVLTAAKFAQVMATLQALDQQVHATPNPMLAGLYQVRK
jgi:hypothetical protein